MSAAIRGTAYCLLAVLLVGALAGCGRKATWKVQVYPVEVCCPVAMGEGLVAYSKLPKDFHELFGHGLAVLDTRTGQSRDVPGTIGIELVPVSASCSSTTLWAWLPRGEPVRKVGVDLQSGRQTLVYQNWEPGPSLPSLGVISGWAASLMLPSPDGRWLAGIYGPAKRDQPQYLVLLPVGGSDLRKLAAVQPSYPLVLAWSHDGSLLAVSHEELGIGYIALQNPELTWLRDARGRCVTFLGNRAVAWIDEKQQICVRRLDGATTIRTKVHALADLNGMSGSSDGDMLAFITDWRDGHRLATMTGLRAVLAERE